MIQPQTNTGELSQLGAVYQLAGRLWLHEINQEFVDWIQQPEVANQLTTIGLEIGDVSQQNIEDLATEYCRLFIGPGPHCSPLQSVHTSGLLSGSAVDSMIEYLAVIQGPLERPSMIDQFGFQLNCMGAILIGSENVSVDENQTGPIELIGGFYSDHVQWGKQLCRQVAELAESGFYQSLIRVTSDLIKEPPTKFLSPTSTKI